MSFWIVTEFVDVPLYLEIENQIAEQSNEADESSEKDEDGTDD